MTAAYIPCYASVVHNLVDMVGRHAWSHLRRGNIEDFACEPTDFAHPRHFFLVKDLDLVPSCELSGDCQQCHPHPLHPHRILPPSHTHTHLHLPTTTASSPHNHPTSPHPSKATHLLTPRTPIDSIIRPPNLLRHDPPRTKRIHRAQRSRKGVGGVGVEMAICVRFRDDARGEEAVQHTVCGFVELLVLSL